jgi:hypothetical protein
MEPILAIAVIAVVAVVADGTAEAVRGVVVEEGYGAGMGMFDE